MPTNKNAMIRYQILDELLSNRYHPRTMQELADEVNVRLLDMGMEPAKGKDDVVGLRCIQKDIKFLQEASPWDVEIEKVPRADMDSSERNHTSYALRYACPSFSIFKKQLTDDEKYLLGEVMSLLGQFDGLPEFDGLDNLKKSLDIRHSWQIISIEKNPLEDKSFLGELFTAISKQWTVDLSYHTYSNPTDIKTIAFYPYLIKEYNRRWYVIGAAASDGKILTFAFDRLDAVRPNDAIPYKPYDGDFADRFGDIIGVTYRDETPTFKITFWVSDASRGYVDTKPLHESQTPIRNDVELRTQYPMLTGGAFYTIDVQDNYELIRELCSYGDSLLVISPESIKAKVVKRQQQMIKAYATLRK